MVYNCEAQAVVWQDVGVTLRQQWNDVRTLRRTNGTRSHEIKRDGRVRRPEVKVAFVTEQWVGLRARLRVLKDDVEALIARYWRPKKECH